MRGCIHVYTGDGKGKTTAAMGLTLRAVGAGKRVFVGQFVKGMKYSEIDAIEKFLPNICVKQYGLMCFIKKNPSKNDVEAAKKGLKEVSEILIYGDYDMVVLDEISIALYYKLFSVNDLLNVLKNKKKKVEVIITGRYAPQKIIAIADLVTEMKELKHYYNNGVEARKGIEF